MTVRFLLASLKVGRWLKIVDADDCGGRLVMYHPGPVLLGADLGALPVNVVYRGAAAYLHFPGSSGEVFVRNEKLKSDLGDLPLRFVRVEGAVRADVRLQRLRQRNVDGGGCRSGLCSRNPGEPALKSANSRGSRRLNFDN